MPTEITIEDQARTAEHEGDGIWLIQSASCPGELRTFNRNTGFCTCLGYQMAKSRGHLCRHGTAVEMRIAADKKPKRRKKGTARDFLASAAACALEVELQADPDTPPAPRPCQACERPEWGTGATKNLCAAHKQVLDEYTRQSYLLDREYLKADSGDWDDRDALRAEYGRRIREIAEAAAEFRKGVAA